MTIGTDLSVYVGGGNSLPYSLYSILIICDINRSIQIDSTVKIPCIPELN